MIHCVKFPIGYSTVQYIRFFVLYSSGVAGGERGKRSPKPRKICKTRGTTHVSASCKPNKEKIQILENFHRYFIKTSKILKSFLIIFKNVSENFQNFFKLLQIFLKKQLHSNLFKMLYICITKLKINKIF